MDPVSDHASTVSERNPLVTFSIPTAWFRTILRALRRAPNSVATGRLGVNLDESGASELLARSFQVVSEREAVRQRRQRGPRFELGFVPQRITQPGAWESAGWAIRFEQDPSSAEVCLVHLGTGDEGGFFTGTYVSGDRMVPVRNLRVVGAGMARFAAVDDVAPCSPPLPEEAERWSRLIGALGGTAVWQRLTDLSIAIVGAGRTGSVVASSLARLGCRTVTLIDPDRLELPNVDAMDLVMPADVGRFKVDVLAERMNELASRVHVLPLAESVLSEAAHKALKTVQVIVSAVDDQAARLATGSLATAYLKPWLDLGTGVFREGNAAGVLLGQGGHPLIQVGADIRLVLPGDGCVLCWGGVANLSQALREWGHPHAPRDWRRERAGSLRSLNMLAVATGLRWLEEMVMGRLTGSVWQRVEINDQGLAEWRTMVPRRDPACLLCAQVGSGDGMAAPQQSYPPP